MSGDLDASEGWNNPRAWPEPTETAVDLWRFRLVEAVGDASLLTEDEAGRARRFLSARHGERFTAGRAKLRRILGRCLGIAPASIPLCYGPNGKPALATDTDLTFNLSHSADWGLLAVSRRRRLGVDLERAREGRSFEAIAERFFSSAECERWRRLGSRERLDAFYRLWTCKEAYLKAWGTGLTFPASRFTVDVHGHDAPDLVSTEMPDDVPGRWWWTWVKARPGYAAAVCAESAGGDALVLRRWDWT